MVRFADRVVIDRPIDDVWAFMTDFFNVPRMPGGSLGVRQTSRGPIGIGATFQGRRSIFGFEARFGFSITEWDPPHTMALSGAGGPFRSAFGRLTLEAVDEGTKYDSLLEFELRPALKLLWPVYRPFNPRFKRSYANDVKHFLEEKIPPRP